MATWTGFCYIDAMIKVPLLVFCLVIIISAAAWLYVNRSSGSYTDCSNPGVNYCACEDASTGDIIYKKNTCQEEGCGMLLYNSSGEFIEPIKETDCDIDLPSFNCSLSYEIVTENCREVSEKYFNDKISQIE